MASMNGHPKSRSDSIISELSTGTIYSNGHLKNKNMSPQNLQQIENAFSTHRDQYTSFDAAVLAGKGSQNHNPSITPIIITEDYSDMPEKKNVIIDDYEATPNDSADKADGGNSISFQLVVHAYRFLMDPT